ncbi:MAG TPA: hypothetical protein VG056_01090 [Pirellulales bacterium]|nr:hypothetical protein [Pirellulales bacterium]
MRKTLFSLLAVALMLSGAARLSAQDKPVAILSVASYDTLQADLEFVGQLADAPDLDKSLDGIIALVTRGQGLKGLDKSKPLGLAVFMDGQTPKGFAFLPIADLKGFLALFPQVNVQDSDGTLEIQGPNGPPGYATQKGSWAFISNDKDTLKSAPADPEKLLGDLSKDYAIAVQFNVQNVPADLRENATQIFRAGVEVGLQQKPGEDDIAYEFRKKMAQAQLKQMETLIKDLDQFTVGWAIDPAAKTTNLDISLTAIATSPIAKQFAEMANVKSDFGGFLLPDAAVTLNVCSKFDQADADQAIALIQTARTKANESIDNDSTIPNDEGKKSAKEVVGQLLDVAEHTVKAGKLDGGAALTMEPNALSFAAGGFVKDGPSLEAAVKKLVALGAADPNFPVVKFDIENHNGIKMHSIAIPMNDDNAKKVFGDTMDVYLGIGAESAYVAFGKNSLTLLKSIIDKPAATGQKNYPFQLNVALTPILEFINSTNPNPGAMMAAQLLSATPGKDHIRLTASVITNGVNYRISAEEGVLKAIGAGATMASGMAGGRGGR